MLFLARTDLALPRGASCHLLGARINKRLLGPILLTLGIILTILALHAMHEIAEAKGLAQDIENFFTRNPTWNPIIKFFGGQVQEKASEYDLPAMLTLITGILLTVAGGIRTLLDIKRNK